MPKPERSNVESEEIAARQQLRILLRDHLQLLGRVFNLLGRVGSRIDGVEFRDISDAQGIRLVLLFRLADDIRAVGHLCEIGYGVQACTLASSAFEVAHTIANIGDNPARAAEWLDHQDLKHPFKGAYTLTQENYQILNLPEDQASFSREYDVYRQLCWWKHANPRLQGHRQRKLWQAHGTFNHSPDTSDDGIRRCWLSLQHCARLSLIAATAFQNDFFIEAIQQEVFIEIAACNLIERDLNNRAIEKWGNERPFKGEW